MMCRSLGAQTEHVGLCLPVTKWRTSVTGHSGTINVMTVITWQALIVPYYDSPPHVYKQDTFTYGLDMVECTPHWLSQRNCSASRTFFPVKIIHVSLGRLLYMSLLCFLLQVFSVVIQVCLFPLPYLRARWQLQGFQAEKRHSSTSIICGDPSLSVSHTHTHIHAHVHAQFATPTCPLLFLTH